MRAAWKALLVMATTACGSIDAVAPAETKEPATGSPTARIVSVPSTTLDKSVPIRVDGVYRHPIGTIDFPEKAAGFARSNIDRYDAEGNDVGVHYRRFWVDAQLLFRAEASVFVYPWRNTGAADFDRQFEFEIRSIRDAQGEIREVRRVDSDARHGGNDVHVRAAEFTYRGGPELGRQPMITILAVFNEGPWRVTIREEIPPPRRDACLTALHELLAALDLPPTGLPAGPDVAAR
jgi:hypothetical protein